MRVGEGLGLLLLFLLVSMLFGMAFSKCENTQRKDAEQKLLELRQEYNGLKAGFDILSKPLEENKRLKADLEIMMLKFENLSLKCKQ